MTLFQDHRTMSERNQIHKLQTRLFYITILALVQQAEHKKIVERQTIQTYCRSHQTCHDCKMSTFKCEWCHDAGCTNDARIHCPKRNFLDNIWKRDMTDHYCTEIITKSPIFVPANIRTFVKLDLRVDDLTLYTRRISCEINLENKVMRIGGSLDKNVVYCDTMVLKTHQPVAIGYVKLHWGGVEKYSNSVLVMVYDCQQMARTCEECKKLINEFKCGWCQETVSCSLIQECPRQQGSWVSKMLSC